MDTARVTTADGNSTQIVKVGLNIKFSTDFHALDVRRIDFDLQAGTEILPNNTFVAGTKMHTFVTAKYENGQFEFILPWDRPKDFAFLPSYKADGQGGAMLACGMFADYYADRGDLFETNYDRLERHLAASNYILDVYHRLDSTGDSKNGIGRPPDNPGQSGGPGTDTYCSSPGATLAQLLAYKYLFLNCGPQYRFSMYQPDVDIISRWLNLYTSPTGIQRFFWLSGDQGVRELNRRIPWGRLFLNSTLGVTYIHSNYAARENDYTFCLPIKYVAGGRVPCGGPAMECVIRSNGCPRTYNVIGVSTSAGCNGVAEREYNAAFNPGVTSYAAVSNVVSVPGGASFKTFTEGYDNCTIRTDGSLGYPACGNDDILTTWLSNVLTWGGYCPSEICTPILVGVNPNIGVAPAVVTSLANAYPNPMNPTATIRYTVGAPGRVTLRVFDVTGRVIKTLVDESRATGAYAVTWDGTNDRGEKVASGVFLYQFEAPGFKSAKKIVILQ
jgi:hypothetical protein